MEPTISTRKADKQMSQRITTNTNYTSLARIGTRTNPRNLVALRTAESDTIGVNVEQSASKKAVRMEMFVPITRSRKGSRRAARLSLTGRQARELYETLDRFYNTRNDS
jgi:hypothetical protein